MRKKALRWIDWTRMQELEALGEYLEPARRKGNRLLEIGGGNGFLACQLAERGFEVVSVDPLPRKPGYFPVQIGDCPGLDFEDRSFDVIFSSNVLEHIEDITAALREMKRLLKPGGLLVHTMPLPFCTMATMITEPIGYFMAIGFVLREGFRFAVAKLFPKNKSASTKSSVKNSVVSAKPLNRKNIITSLKILNPIHIFFPPPHGRSTSCFTELHDWKSEFWCKKFKQQGFNIQAVIPLPLSYSRNIIFPFRFMGIRRRWAATGGSSCCGYILRV